MRTSRVILANRIQNDHNTLTLLQYGHFPRASWDFTNVDFFNVKDVIYLVKSEIKLCLLVIDEV
jgi:hypothetical protein